MNNNYKKKYDKYKSKYLKLKILRNKRIMNGGSKLQIDSHKEAFSKNTTVSVQDATGVTEYKKPKFIFHYVTGDGNCFYYSFLLALKNLLKNNSAMIPELFDINIRDMNTKKDEYQREFVNVEFVNILRGILERLCNDEIIDGMKDLCLAEVQSRNWGGEYALTLLIHYIRDVHNTEIRVVVYDVESNGSVHSVRVYFNNDEPVDLDKNNTIFLMRTGRAHYQWLELDNSEYNTRNRQYNYKFTENPRIINFSELDKIDKIVLTEEEKEILNKDYQWLEYISVRDTENLEEALKRSLKEQLFSDKRESKQIEEAIRKSLEDIQGDINCKIINSDKKKDLKDYNKMLAYNGNTLEEISEEDYKKINKDDIFLEIECENEDDSNIKSYLETNFLNYKNPEYVSLKSTTKTSNVVGLTNTVEMNKPIEGKHNQYNFQVSGQRLGQKGQSACTFIAYSAATRLLMENDLNKKNLEQIINDSLDEGIKIYLEKFPLANDTDTAEQAGFDDIKSVGNKYNKQDNLNTEWESQMTVISEESTVYNFLNNTINKVIDRLKENESIVLISSPETVSITFKNNIYYYFDSHNMYNLPYFSYNNATIIPFKKDTIIKFITEERFPNWKVNGSDGMMEYIKISK